jgi:hypothetical protein
MSYCFRGRDECITAVQPLYSNGCQASVREAVCYTAFHKSEQSLVVECSVTLAHCEQKRAATAARIEDYDQVAMCESWS